MAPIHSTNFYHFVCLYLRKIFVSLHVIEPQIHNYVYIIFFCQSENKTTWNIFSSFLIQSTCSGCSFYTRYECMNHMHMSPCPIGREFKFQENHLPNWPHLFELSNFFTNFFLPMSSPNDCRLQSFLHLYRHSHINGIKESIINSQNKHYFYFLSFIHICL